MSITLQSHIITQKPMFMVLFGFIYVGFYARTKMLVFGLNIDYSDYLKGVLR